MANKEWEELKKRLEFSERKRAFLQKRLSKGSIEEDSTLWSFVDLMTLLLILFILFYSHAMTHKGSADNPPNPQTQTIVAQSAQNEKTPVIPEAAAQTPQNENAPKTSVPVANNHNEPQPEPSDIETEEQAEPFEQLKQQVLQTVSEEDQDDVSIRWNQKRLVMVLGERIAFNVGEANLLTDFQPTLKRIAGFISSQKGYKIEVAGHTDDAPIKTVQFPSNWELSAIRAVNVAKFMIASGVDPQRVSIQGYSAFRPLYANTTADNKQANRRVEITLIKETETETAAQAGGDPIFLNEALKHPRPAGLSVYPNHQRHTASEYSYYDSLP